MYTNFDFKIFSQTFKYYKYILADGFSIFPMFLCISFILYLYKLKIFPISSLQLHISVLKNYT